MTTEARTVDKKEREVTKVKPKHPGRRYAPPVDIYEDKEHYVLLVDMPGVNEKNARVTVENQVLTIEGKVGRDMPESYALVRAEHNASDFRRVFQLSDEVDPTAIKGSMKHGVLKVVLSKKEEVKPKKVEITIE